MNVSVIAAGWVTSHGYGTLKSREEQVFAEGETIYSAAKSSIFTRPVRNFGRLDRLSRITLATVALALKDAGIEASPEKKVDVGIIGTNSTGSLETDCDFFRDYLDNGRKLARANLFIYTLPSSPLGEASIHFGLKGALLYTAYGEDPLKSLLSTSALMIEAGEAGMMLAGMTSGDEGLYFLLGEGEGISSVSALLELLDTDSDISTVVTKARKLTRLV
ncbi:MAG: hypothetical protein HXX17_01065 [Geobacteraceae bacterium]|nr:hypothetical protein [Geobacteraceae bacterium]